MITVSAPPWMKDALCQEYPAEWFFPQARGTSGYRAKRVCRRCLVREECLDFAIRSKEQFGVWGGYNFNNIERVRRARWDNPCRLCHARIPMADVAALAAADVEPSHWCCSACRQLLVAQLVSA